MSDGVDMQGTFNSEDEKGRDRGFDPLPAGWYAMQVCKTEKIATKAGDGQFLLKFEFEIIESYHPNLSGRKIWDQLNLWNNSKKASKIARENLSELAEAVGEPIFTHTSALHFKPLAVKLKVETGDYEGNEVQRYEALSKRFGGGDAASAATPGSEPGEAPKGDEPPPWGAQG